MLFAEPPRTRYDLNFGVLGIPVRVHPLFWLITILLGMRGAPEAKQMMIWVGAVFVSILAHELGHALAAKSFGWPPHITLHGFGGLASYRPTYRSPRNQILITLAGPGAGFLFAILILATIKASGHGIEFGWRGGRSLPFRFEGYESMNLNVLISDLLFINIYWGLVNLLPIYPLDGGQIAQELLSLNNPQDGMRQSLYLSMAVAVGVAILALFKLQDQFLAIFFAYLAYTNYATIKAYFGGGWGGFR